MKEDSIWVKNLLFLQNCWALTTIRKNKRDSKRQDQRNFFGAILIFGQTIWELLLGFRHACFSGIIMLATFFSKRWKHFLHYFHQKIKTPKIFSFFFRRCKELNYLISSSDKKIWRFSRSWCFCYKEKFCLKSEVNH